ncbi:hypothetical protein [Streptomyces sp. NPDC092295]|uniref:hypothetical protein n=1 Tax=Streptomyces sp. NPDC092295 TaxID=3366011 RepID=UPI00380E9350
MAITTTVRAEAADEKRGLTLGELRKLLEAVDPSADDDTPIRVRVGWRSQITRIEIG